MKRKLTLLFAILLCLSASVSAQETKEKESLKYYPRWESLMRYEAPEWFKDAKFGIFIHWGVYSVPAYNGVGWYAEWYPRDMYRKEHDSYAHHTEVYGKPGSKGAGYADFIKDFKAEKFDPEAWADLFQRAGAKLVIPVAEHHDGFAMWDSDLTPWNAKKMGPKRDVIGELCKAVRARNMKFAASYHRERHFAYFTEHDGSWLDGQPFEGVREEIARNPKLKDFYGPFDVDEAFLKDYKARWDEICEKYQPDMMWFDGAQFTKVLDDPRIIAFQDTMRTMVSEYLNKETEWGKRLIVNNKGPGPNFPVGFGVREQDYLVASHIMEKPWINSRGMGTSYGINICEEELGAYPSVDELVELLVDAVSKNGFFLLNIGPKADGTISKYQVERLEGIGKWLAVNGEAIYGTRPWKTYGGDNIRYTRKGDDLYVHILTHPGMFLMLDDTVIPFEKGKTKIISLQTGKTLSWSYATHGMSGVKVKMPLREDSDSNNPLNSVYVLKIEGAAK